MPIPINAVYALARRLGWSPDDTESCLEAMLLESNGMTVEAAASVIYYINKSVVEMTPAVASTVVLSAAYHVDVANQATGLSRIAGI